MSVLFEHHLICGPPDLVRLFGLKLHFVNFSQLGIEHLIRADVLVSFEHVLLVLELSIQAV